MCPNPLAGGRKGSFLPSSLRSWRKQLDPQLWVKTMGTSRAAHTALSQLSPGTAHPSLCRKAPDLGAFPSRGLPSAKSNPLSEELSVLQTLNCRVSVWPLGTAPAEAAPHKLEKAVWELWEKWGHAGVHAGTTETRPGDCVSFGKTSSDWVWGRPGAGKGSSMLLTYNRDPLWSSKWHWNRDVNDSMPYALATAWD